MSQRRRPLLLDLLLVLSLALLAGLGLHGNREQRVESNGARSPAPAPLSTTRTRMPLVTAMAPHDIDAATSVQPESASKTNSVSLSGTVVDATGGPIPSARVRALQGEGTPTPATVLCDEGGRFALSLPAGDVTVRAEADGYASKSLRTQVPNTTVELKLTPEASLSGVVVSALDGRPLAEIEVLAFKHSPLVMLDGDGRTLSAADGSFSIRGLSSGTYHVHARSPRWSGSAGRTVSLSIAEPGGPVRVEARPAVTVSGSVQLAGAHAPCTAGTVFMGAADATESASFAASSAIAADGAFRFSGVPAGTYALRVECRDALAGTYPPLRVAEKDVAALKLEVEQGLVLTGRVVDTRGRGLADRAISIEPDESAPTTQAGQALGAGARSDAQGAFSAKGLAPGVYHVRLSDDEQIAARVELARGRAARDVTLVIAATSSLRVVVESADERGRAALSVSVSSQFGERAAQRSLDGSYLLRDLRAGDYTVSVSDGKGPSITQRVQLADGQEGQARIALTKQRDVLSGRVIDSSGNPVGDAWVRASRSASSLYEGASGEAVLTDADGNFEIPQLAGSETYDVEAYVAEETKTISRGLKPGQWITLRLETSRKL